VINPGRIQDPERAKTSVISFKTATGAVAAIHKQTYKIVCFGDATSGRLRVDKTATTGGKQYPSKYGRKSIFIYKSYMYSEASLDPERCNFKTDHKARNQWVSLSRPIRRPGTSGFPATPGKSDNLRMSAALLTIHATKRWRRKQSERTRATCIPTQD